MIESFTSQVLVNSRQEFWPLGDGILTSGAAYIPTLDLQFAGATSLDSRITFTRASTATYFNSAGVLSTAAINTARLDYNPSTLAPLGLLIEEQRTNSLRYSAQLDNAVWGKDRATVTADSATAPDGTVTADSIVEDATAANSHDVRQGSVTNSATTTWSLTFYIKAVNRTWALIELQNNAATSNRARAWFNLQTGVVGTGGAAGTGITYVSHSIQNVGNGWYRCTLISTADVSVATVQAWAEGTIADNTTNYDGVNGQTSVYIWGAQLEAGAFATSYIPTTTTALTRNADVASMTGTNFSSWYNATQGTLFEQIFPNAPVSYGTNQYLSSISDGTVSNRISLFRVLASGLLGSRITTAGVAANPSDSAAAISSNTVSKLTMSYKAGANNSVSCLNGVLTSASSPTSLPVVNALYLGVNELGSAQFMNGYIQRIAYYPTRLANSTLQALTA